MYTMIHMNILQESIGYYFKNYREKDLGDYRIMQALAILAISLIYSYTGDSSPAWPDLILVRDFVV